MKKAVSPAVTSGELGRVPNILSSEERLSKNSEIMTELALWFLPVGCGCSALRHPPSVIIRAKFCVKVGVEKLFGRAKNLNLLSKLAGDILHFTVLRPLSYKLSEFFRLARELLGDCGSSRKNHSNIKKFAYDPH